MVSNNHYPFGLKHKGYNNAPLTNHPYKYQGKELNEELGLDWYDFGWRNYDASLGRWMNTDPLADLRYELTPYNFVQNNPLLRIDPNGLTDYKLNKKTGEITRIGDINDEPDKLFITRKGKIKKNKKTGKIKNKSIDNVAKGILKDGQNFKSEDNFVDVNGTNEDGSTQASSEQVENFALALSKEVGKEISGHGFGDSDGVKKIALWKYEGNSMDGSKNPKVYSRQTSSTQSNIFGSSRIPSDLKASMSVIYHFHTHIISKSNLWENPNNPSEEDKKYRNDMSVSPFKKYKFYIRNSNGKKEYTND